MKIWVTKYALTEGILVFEEAERLDDGAVRSGPGGGMGSYVQLFFGLGKDWHETEESANERASVMRDRKILALEKQIKKLSNTKFGGR